MSKTRTATFEARYLIAIPQALDKISGRRPIMLGYKFGQVLGEVRRLHNALREALLPYTDTEKGLLRDDLSEEEEAEVNALLAEELSCGVPVIKLQDLAEAGLTVNDDSVLLFLTADVDIFVP